MSEDGIRTLSDCVPFIGFVKSEEFSAGICSKQATMLELGLRRLSGHLLACFILYGLWVIARAASNFSLCAVS